MHKRPGFESHIGRCVFSLDFLFIINNLKLAYLNEFKIIIISKITQTWLILAYIAFTLGWTINGKNNTEKLFCWCYYNKGVRRQKKIYIDGRRKAKLI